MTLSNIPFIGLGFLACGFVGFAGIAIVLNEHFDLFAIILCWYIVMISFAAFALGKGARRWPVFRLVTLVSSKAWRHRAVARAG
ncbi:hypothetical protein [Rhizobium tumorigenes]|uniref:hypothetical protein n=1 Tax=Rhizobium tumorigenes TaxID=2041385 RepID=UPI00241CA33B|nr:hypothetical protein [Rhizobium tumorigenes]WFS00846.1 hypothetical protein PR016_17390 [Rhizobium tumorigenes]